MIKKFGAGGQRVSKMIADHKVTPISRTVIKYWIMRMRLIRKLRIYV